MTCHLFFNGVITETNDNGYSLRNRTGRYFRHSHYSTGPTYGFINGQGQHFSYLQESDMPKEFLVGLLLLGIT